MVVLMNVGEFLWRRLNAKVSFNHQICLTKRDSVMVTGGGMGRMKGFARAVGVWGVAPGARGVYEVCERAGSHRRSGGQRFFQGRSAEKHRVLVGGL